MVSEKIIKELGGFSGCKIYLMERGEYFFVRKISKSEDYNSRLIKQKEKQDFFNKNLQNKKIKTPKVLGEGYVEKLFYFDMEYIVGRSIIEKIEEANLDDLKRISSDILDLLRTLNSYELEGNLLFKETLLKKLNSIKEIEKESLAKEVVKKTIGRLLSKKEKEIKKTFCHGDLTLENILYNESERAYYLIDFLDSFVDNYWQDISKLFQDLEGHWYLFRNKEIDQTNMEIKMQVIVDAMLKDDLLKKNDYQEYHTLLLATTFCRILPYASENEKSWIENRIGFILD